MAKGISCSHHKELSLVLHIAHGFSEPRFSATEEGAKINEQRYKISVPENKMTTYPAVLAFFFLENVWDMAMISLNTFSVVLTRVSDACSISSSQNYAKKIHVFERGFGERKHNNFRWIVGACCLTFFFPWVNLRKEVGNNINLSFLQVIGQCKVIAITFLAGPEDLRVNDFNCTTSSGMIAC